MKHIVFAIICTTLSSHCCEQKNIIIRPAKIDDIEPLNQLSIKQYQNDLKPLWINYYAPIFPHIDSETFIAAKTNLNNEMNAQIIKNKNPNDPKRLIIAEMKDKQNSSGRVVGFCRFESKNEQIIYMHFVLVDEEFRRHGIAKQLLTTALKTLPSLTACKFRAHVYNETLNNIYTQHGCKQIAKVAVDLSTGLVSNDPNAPITHYDYEYTVPKS